MKIEQKPSRLGDFAVLLTFGMFALCILLVLLGSARLYQTLTERDLRSYDARTVTQYLSTRLHQADQENAHRHKLGSRTKQADTTQQHILQNRQRQ